MLRTKERGDYSLWIQLVPVILTAGGVALYAFLLFGYQRFYGAFHLSPSQVGLGYASTLTRSEGASLLLILVTSVSLGSRMLAERLHRPGWAALATSLLSVCIAAATFVLSGSAINHRIRSAKCGIGSTVIKAWFLPIFDLRSEPATITMLDPKGPVDIAIQSDRYVLLGQADGQDILWNVDRSKTVILPNSSVIVTVTAGPHDCPARS